MLTLCLAVGCSGETAESGEPVSEESVPVGEIAVENASLSESGKSGESVPETSAASESTETAFQAPPASESEDEKVVLWSAPNGEIFSMDRDKDVSYGITFDKVLYRPSTGAFYEYTPDSEWFDRESGMFTGEPIEFDESDFRCIHSGETVNGYTVDVETSFYPDDRDLARLPGPHAMEITFRDNVTLTGYLLYCAYDEPTQIGNGDFFMIADNSAEGLPVLNFFYWVHGDGRIEPRSQANRREPWIGCYKDYYTILLGNFYQDYAEREDLKALIGDLSSSRAWRASVTIERLTIDATSASSLEGCFGRIVRVEESANGEK